MVFGIEKESDWIEGKGRRCWLEDEIDSSPCRTSDLAPGWFEEKNEEKKGHLAEWMRWKNGWSSGSHHTKPQPSQNWSSSKTFSQIILLLNV